MSKLRRLLRMINFMMQDSLVFVAEVCRRGPQGGRDGAPNQSANRSPQPNWPQPDYQPEPPTREPSTRDPTASPQRAPNQNAPDRSPQTTAPKPQPPTCAPDAPLASHATDLLVPPPLVARQASLRAYSDLLCERAAYRVDVRSATHVVSTPLGAAQRSKNLPPLFATELVARDGEGIAYRIEPSAFVEGALGVFDVALASVQTIPQLEKHVMEGLFWSDTPVLQTVAAHEGVPPACRQRFHEALLATLPPMEAYLRLYDGYLETVRTPVDGYLTEYAAQQKSIGEMKVRWRGSIAPDEA